MGGKIDLLKGEFNSWTVLSRSGSDKRGNVTWLCRCVCGEERVVESSCLRRNVSKSCGCQSKRRARSEGGLPPSVTGQLKDFDYNVALFSVWRNVIVRCYDKRFHRYPDWGGRGITVAPEWHSAINFYAWAKPSLFYYKKREGK